MDTTLIEKARQVMAQINAERTGNAVAQAKPRITVADVLAVFPGARVLTSDEVEALMAVEGLPQ